jgi:hypothetical protein
MPITPEQKEQEKKRREAELNDLKVALKSNETLRVFWRILSVGGLYRNPFIVAQGKKEYRDFNCGLQYMAQWLMAEIEQADPTVMEKMKRMHASRETMDKIDFEELLDNKTVLTRS